MNIKSSIRNFLINKNTIQSINDNDSLLENGIIDSLKMIELINFIEEKYTIHIDEDELMPENFDSISVISNFIQKKIS